MIPRTKIITTNGQTRPAKKPPINAGIQPNIKPSKSPHVDIAYIQITKKVIIPVIKPHVV